MSSLDTIKDKIKEEVDLLPVLVETASSVNALGGYRASYEALGIICYGLSIQQALDNARNEAYALALNAGSLKRALEIRLEAKSA